VVLEVVLDAAMVTKQGLMAITPRTESATNKAWPLYLCSEHTSPSRYFLTTAVSRSVTTSPSVVFDTAFYEHVQANTTLGFHITMSSAAMREAPIEDLCSYNLSPATAHTKTRTNCWSKLPREIQIMILTRLFCDTRARIIRAQMQYGTVRLLCDQLADVMCLYGDDGTYLDHTGERVTFEWMLDDLRRGGKDDEDTCGSLQHYHYFMACRLRLVSKEMTPLLAAVLEKDLLGLTPDELTSTWARRVCPMYAKEVAAFEASNEPDRLMPTWDKHKYHYVNIKGWERPCSFCSYPKQCLAQAYSREDEVWKDVSCAYETLARLQRVCRARAAGSQEQFIHDRRLNPDKYRVATWGSSEEEEEERKEREKLLTWGGEEKPWDGTSPPGLPVGPWDIIK
jgi:hypothetical protein